MRVAAAIVQLCSANGGSPQTAGSKSSRLGRTRSACFVRLLSSSTSGTITTDLHQSQDMLLSTFGLAKTDCRHRLIAVAAAGPPTNSHMHITQLLLSSDLCRLINRYLLLLSNVAGCDSSSFMLSHSTSKLCLTFDPASLLTFILIVVQIALH